MVRTRSWVRVPSAALFVSRPGISNEYRGPSKPDLFQVPAWVIHLDRQSGSGAVTVDELKSSLGDRLKRHSEIPAIIINALGTKRFDEIANRSVYLSADAVQWLISCGIRLIVSDIYESDENPQSVFLRFFKAGVSTVCCPINLDKLSEEVKLTVMFSRFKKITQIPCRIIAQTE